MGLVQLVEVSDGEMMYVNRENLLAAADRVMQYLSASQQAFTMHVESRFKKEIMNAVYTNPEKAKEFLSNIATYEHMAFKLARLCGQSGYKKKEDYLIYHLQRIRETLECCGWVFEE